jgi:hypothetical protein
MTLIYMGTYLSLVQAIFFSSYSVCMKKASTDQVSSGLRLDRFGICSSESEYKLYFTLRNVQAVCLIGTGLPDTAGILYDYDRVSVADCELLSTVYKEDVKNVLPII